MPGRPGVPFLLDACQSVGQMPVDVDEIGCDLLSATGRKFLRAPRGTGFLYVRRALLERLERLRAGVPRPARRHWIAPDGYELRPDARRFENWESNLAAVAGLRCRGHLRPVVGARRHRRAGRRRWPRHCEAGSAEVPGVQVHDLGRHRSGIVTFTVDGVAAADVQARLPGQGINVSVSEPSSTRLDAERRRLPSLGACVGPLRHHDAELDRLTGAVGDMVARARL